MCCSLFSFHIWGMFLFMMQFKTSVNKVTSQNRVKTGYEKIFYHLQGIKPCVSLQSAFFHSQFFVFSLRTVDALSMSKVMGVILSDLPL